MSRITFEDVLSASQRMKVRLGRFRPNRGGRSESARKQMFDDVESLAFPTAFPKLTERMVRRWRGRNSFIP
jgi:hypothetical protein